MQLTIMTELKMSYRAIGVSAVGNICVVCTTLQASYINSSCHEHNTQHDKLQHTYNGPPPLNVGDSSRSYLCHGSDFRVGEASVTFSEIYEILHGPSSGFIRGTPIGPMTERLPMPGAVTFRLPPSEKLPSN